MFKNSQGAQYAVGALAFAPAVVNADANGATIDRQQLTSGQQGYDSALFTLVTGVAVGSTPYARILIEDSADGSSWAALTDPNTGSQYVTGTITASLAAYVDVDLSRARRYVRAAVDFTANGGTSVLCSVACTLLGPKEGPIQ